MVNLVKDKFFIFAVCVFFVVLEVILVPICLEAWKNNRKKRPKAQRFFRYLMCSFIIFVFIIYKSATLAADFINEKLLEDKANGNKHQNEGTPREDENKNQSFVEEYIILASTREISKEELSQFSKEDLFWIRNGIYAYCGRSFLEQEITQYFAKFEWYKPVVKAEDFRWEIFNEAQARTIINIKSIEK